MRRFPDRNAEARIQAAIVEWIRTVAPQVKVWAVPNGGLRGKREAALLKWTGVLAGVFDLTIVGRNGQCWLIEVKTDSGSLSDDQEAFFDWCVSNDVPRCICRSIDDARRAFAMWGIETREVQFRGDAKRAFFNVAEELRLKA